MSKRLEAIKNTHAVCSKLFPDAKDVWDDFDYIIARAERLEAALNGLHCAYGAKLGESHADCGKYAGLCGPCKARKALEEP